MASRKQQHQRKSLSKIILSVICAFALVISSLLPFAQAPEQADAAPTPHYFLTGKFNNDAVVPGFGGIGSSDPDVYVSLYVAADNSPGVPAEAPGGTTFTYNTNFPVTPAWPDPSTIVAGNDANAEHYSQSLLWPNFADVSSSMLNRMHGGYLTAANDVVIPARYNQVRDDIMLSARSKEALPTTYGPTTTLGSNDGVYDSQYDGMLVLNQVAKPHIQASLADDQNNTLVWGGSTSSSATAAQTTTHQYFNAKVSAHQTDEVLNDWRWGLQNSTQSWLGDPVTLQQRALMAFNHDMYWAGVKIPRVGFLATSPDTPYYRAALLGNSGNTFISNFPEFGGNAGSGSTKVLIAEEWHRAFNLGTDNAQLGAIGLFNDFMSFGSGAGLNAARERFPSYFVGGMGAQLAMQGFYRNGLDATAAQNSYLLDSASYVADNLTRQSDASYKVRVNADITNADNTSQSLTGAPITFTIEITRPYFQTGNDSLVAAYNKGDHASFLNAAGSSSVSIHDDGILPAADSSGAAQPILADATAVKIYASTAPNPDWAAIIGSGTAAYTYETLEPYLNSLAVGDEVQLLYTYMAADSATATWTPDLTDDAGAYAVPLVRTVSITEQASPPTYTVDFAPGAYGTWTLSTGGYYFSGRADGSVVPAAPLVTPSNSSAWVFDAWVFDANRNAAIEISETTLYSASDVVNAADRRYVARWKEVHPDPIYYTITYHSSGHTQGTVPAATSHLAGSATAIKTKGSLLRSGYSFLGWSASVQADSVTHPAGASVTLNDHLNLYAVWQQDAPPPPPPPTPPTPEPPVVPPPVTPPVIQPVTPPVTQPVVTVPVVTQPEPTPAAPQPQRPVTPTQPVQPSPVTPPEPEANLRQVSDGGVPLGSLFDTNVWSLVSLILSVLAVLMVLVLVFVVCRRRSDVYYQDNQRRAMPAFVAAAITGLATPIVWLILDDLSLKMALLNFWTIFVGLVFIVSLALTLLYMILAKRADEPLNADLSDQSWERLVDIP